MHVATTATATTTTTKNNRQKQETSGSAEETKLHTGKNVGAIGTSRPPPPLRSAQTRRRGPSLGAFARGPEGLTPPSRKGKAKKARWICRECHSLRGLVAWRTDVLTAKSLRFAILPDRVNSSQARTKDQPADFNGLTRRRDAFHANAWHVPVYMRSSSTHVPDGVEGGGAVPWLI